MSVGICRAASVCRDAEQQGQRTVTRTARRCATNALLPQAAVSPACSTHRHSSAASTRCRLALPINLNRSVCGPVRRTVQSNPVLMIILLPSLQRRCFKRHSQKSSDKLRASSGRLQAAEPGLLSVVRNRLRSLSLSPAGLRDRPPIGRRSLDQHRLQETTTPGSRFRGPRHATHFFSGRSIGQHLIKLARR